MKRLKIAQYIAVVATVSTVIGILTGGLEETLVGTVLMSIGFTLGMLSYLFGGLWKAIKMAGGIAKWGWIAVPFPYDIATFFITFILAVVVFLYLPIIPIHKAYKESLHC